MLIIENASILLGPELEYIERGYIRIDSGVIVDAGPGKAGGSGKRLDAGGFLVIPALSTRTLTSPTR